jgi:hypothetical protein
MTIEREEFVPSMQALADKMRRYQASGHQARSAITKKEADYIMKLWPPDNRTPDQQEYDDWCYAEEPYLHGR